MPSVRLRKKNTQNPQLVTQHCFVASFGRWCPVFHLAWSTCRATNTFVAVVAERRRGVNFEQQILALLLVFHQTHNLARNKFARAQATQPIRALHFFDPQQMFLLRIKLIMRGEKRETSTTTCNETMLRDKLKVFVSRISSPLETTADYTRYTLAQKLKRWVLVNSRIKSFGSNRNIGSVIMKYLACTHSLFLKIGIFL